MQYRISIVAKLFIIMVCVLLGCTPKISKWNAYNRYLKGFTIQVYNDSLQFYFRSPADINYFQSPKMIEQKLKGSLLKPKNEVLFYGTTNDPVYELAVTVGHKKELYQASRFVLDTLIANTPLHFIAIPADPTALAVLKADLDAMVNSIKTGSHYTDEKNTVMDIVNNSMQSNRFFQTLSEIKQFPIPKNQGNSLELQMQLTYASFLANNPDYTALIAKQEAAFSPADSILNVVKGGKTSNEAVFDTIVAQAKVKRLVMLNENHFYPNHRLAIIELLPRLKAIGYNYLALEALSNDTLLNLPEAFPNLATGFYTREQHYGNLLRTAKQLGFKFVSYEHTGANKDREIKQAENLYRKTFAEDNTAKVLVVAGIDHILEKPDNNGKKWMAELFVEQYHIDTQTISQTHLNLYRKFSPFSYQLIAADELKSKQNIAGVDYFLLNNANEDWKTWDAKLNYHNKYPETVQVSLFEQHELKNSSAYQTAIPYFTGLVKAKQTYALPLPYNEAVELVVYNQLGQVLSKETVKAKK